MQVGIQTISWGQTIPDVPEFLARVKSLGFSGVEFAQLTSTLPPADALQAQFAAATIQLLGFAGGSLKTRLDYSRNLNKAYLYCDDWDEAAVVQALDENVTIGLHPHLYKDIETVAQAEPYLNKYPKLQLILDCAHLHLANDNVVTELERYEDRIVAIHIKDWTSRFGRSPYRFSEGFTTLGRGELEILLKEMIEWLLKREYPGWLVVEEDPPAKDPYEHAAQSMEWLRRQGV